MGFLKIFGLEQTNQEIDVTKSDVSLSSNVATKFVRFSENPIISPDEKEWRSLATYSPAAIFLDNRVHIIYRAQGKDKVSVLGYACSGDGLHINENLDFPVYTPRESFEKFTIQGWNSGCEDPRITKIGNMLYMTYTAYDGTSPPRVALTSISISDFLKKEWNWEMPKLISPPGVDDKDSCIVENTRGTGYLAFHRLGNVIWLDILKDLNFHEKNFLTGGIIAQARPDQWDNVKIGIASPPIESERGWILLYHAVSNPGFVYKIGAMLLDFNDPRKILARTSEPLLEPDMPYEKEGQVPNVVFGCGAVVIDGTVYMYYGAADSVVGVVTIPLASLLDVLST